MRVLAIILVIAGILGLAYGGFTYTKHTEQAQIGPIELSVKENKTIPIPVWAGVAAIVLGGVLLIVGSKGGRV